MRLNKGLSLKNLRPYKVIAVLEKYAVVLQLLDYYKHVYLVFYPWLLHINAN